MLVFGHTGITLGIFGLSHSLLSGRFSAPAFMSVSTKSASTNSTKWHIDYRFVLLGSMFPDIVDKPIGMLIFANTIANGRVYFHTLLVNLILLSVGFYLLKRKRPHFLIFSLASSFHLVLDRMWLFPITFLWPLYGWRFPPGDISHWWQNMLNNLLTNPWTYWFEIVGATILLTFAIMLIKKETVGKFLLKGIS